jgi:hypothetical protein
MSSQPHNWRILEVWKGFEEMKIFTSLVEMNTGKSRFW